VGGWAYYGVARAPGPDAMVDNFKSNLRSYFEQSDARSMLQSILEGPILQQSPATFIT